MRAIRRFRRHHKVLQPEPEDLAKKKGVPKVLILIGAIFAAAMMVIGLTMNLPALTVAISRFRGQAGRLTRMRPAPSVRRWLALGHSPQGLAAYRLRQVVAALAEILRRARTLSRPDPELPGLSETP